MGQDEITALEHAFIATTTTEQVMAFMDEDHVRYDYDMPLQRVGGAALRAAFDQFFDNCKEPVGRFLSLHVEANEGMGVAHSLMHFTWNDLAGKPSEGTFRVTHVLHKKNAQWKIFHTHVSFPMNPATGRVETNLRA
ncbi:MAG: YybH family protein [Panacagrimonas sp.]